MESSTQSAKKPAYQIVVFWFDRNRLLPQQSKNQSVLGKKKLVKWWILLYFHSTEEDDKNKSKDNESIKKRIHIKKEQELNSAKIWPKCHKHHHNAELGRRKGKQNRR